MRDVGFVELVAEQYELLLCHSSSDGDVPPAFLQILQDSDTALAGTNLRAALLDVGQAPDSPAMGVYRASGAPPPPCALLVSPQGRTLQLAPPTGTGNASGEQIRAFLESLVASPLRRGMTAQLPLHHSLLLLFEGKDPGANATAHTKAREAVALVERSMDLLPKAAGKPPVIDVVPWESRSEEALLAWAFEREIEDPRPAIAVVYGRGRRIGPLVYPGESDADALISVLSKVGLSCECGLDRAWMMGLRFPMRWGAKIQATAAQSLGFDPENPEVRMEIGQILDHAGAGAGESRERSASDTEWTVLGYREEVVQAAGIQPVEETVPTEQNQAAEKPAAPVQAQHPLRRAYLFLLGCGLIILCASATLTIRARRRSKCRS